MSLNKSILGLALICSMQFSCSDKAGEGDDEAEFKSVSEAISMIASLEDAGERKRQSEKLFNSLLDTASIPYTYADSAIFIYKGAVNSINWNGDFNAWSNDKRFDNKGINIDSTDFWYLKQRFPADARLDYKVTLNNNQWILDPNNPHQQWSGFGPNSELRMPLWEEESIGYQMEDIPTGTIDSFTLRSEALNYEVAFKVYTPAGYETMENLAHIYVTDGHEYLDDKLGNIATISDNLIAQQKIEPIVIILVDPRNPKNLNENRRQKEYVVNLNYLDFVANELIPEINVKFNVDPNRRAILGTSLGGLNASYFGAARPDLFPFVAAQSPAYWYNTTIFSKAENAVPAPKKVFISAGTFNDGLENAEKMRLVYNNGNAELLFMEVNEGHSWGAWTQQLDNILIHFFSKS